MALWVATRARRSKVLGQGVAAGMRVANRLHRRIVPRQLNSLVVRWNFALDDFDRNGILLLSINVGLLRRTVIRGSQTMHTFSKVGI